MKLALQIVVLTLSFILVILPLSHASIITGNETTYNVEEHDSLLLISAKLGVDTETIIRENGLDNAEQITPGQVLKLNTRKIAPKTTDNGIIIDIAGRMLYFFKAGRLELSFPVGLGMAKWKGMTRWRTPSGPFTITGKERNPIWYVPESIQQEMQAQNKPMLTRVPPGPDNPLGTYVLYTSMKGICIHETIWPTTVYRYRSHGCIRVLKQNIAQLYDAIDVGMAGELVYDPVKVAVTDEGTIYLEVDPDVYGKAGELIEEVVKQCNNLSVTEKVDWDKARKIIHDLTGNAESIGKSSDRVKSLTLSVST